MKYDVFISFKSEDYKFAAELNKYLISKGLSVFFSEVSLTDLGVSEYSDVIDRALDNSTHMIVVASDVAFLNQGWVHYEWSTFANELKSCRKDGNLIAIISSDIKPESLPIGLRHRQCFNMRNYKDEILGYLGKFSENGISVRKKRRRPTLLVCIIVFLCLVLTGSISTLLVSHNEARYPDRVKSSALSDVIQLCHDFRADVDSVQIMNCYHEAKSGNSDAQFQLGNIYYDHEIFEDAICWFSLSAKQGNPRAANGLGRCYYNANGVTRSPRNAFNWFRVSAEHGCPEGLNNVGKCYEEGFGTMFPNKRKATKYYRAAADLSYAPAQYNLGISYYFGFGIKQDKEAGLNWLRKAAYTGSSSANFALGNIYIDEDVSTASAWYRKAMNSNDEKIRKKAEAALKQIKDKN